MMNLNATNRVANRCKHINTATNVFINNKTVNNNNNNMYTLNINQSNVSTKLKKHDFVIPEIEVTSQLIDLRSSATLC